MAEKQEYKPRKCNKCELPIISTAKTIKEHEVDCKGSK